MLIDTNTSPNPIKTSALSMSAHRTTRPMDNNPRRSSRRIQGLAPQTQLSDAPLRKEVYLPPEVKVAVLSSLYKRDLKNVRLVSKEWNALATGPLFDRVYVSCRAVDMEVFKNMTSHPVISSVVKEVVFDGSQFTKNMKFKDYFDEIYYFVVRFIALETEPDMLFKSADVQINKFVRDYKKKTSSRSKLYKTHKLDTFLVEGHQKYRDYSAFEHRYVERGSLFDDLYTGFCSLENLHSVVLNAKMWHHHFHENEHFGTTNPNTLKGPSLGSPLCRSWNPFHLRPQGWKMVPDVDGGQSDMCAQFLISTQAIAATNKKITSLQTATDGVGGGIPQQALMKSNIFDYELQYILSAYSGLSCLDITVTTDDRDQQGALTVLPRLLEQTCGLRRLSLHLDKTVHGSLISRGVSGYYRYDEIFPALGIWRKLAELSISGLAIGGWDLMKLILARARLRQLKLSSIDLLDGTWEGVIEGMAHLPRLIELKMHRDFRHCGGALFRPSIAYDKFTDWKILEAIESYVVCGGRHPCLTPESDPNTASWWYFDLMPEKELEDLKLSARQEGMDTDGLFRK